MIDHGVKTPHQPYVRVIYDTVKASRADPYDVDLARSMGHGGADRILRHEPPGRWSIDPLSYLG